jgi:hypothetical protein
VLPDGHVDAAPELTCSHVGGWQVL